MLTIRRCAWLTCLAVLLSAPPALVRAAQFLPLEDQCNGRQLMIKGPIERGDYDRFVARLARMVTGGDLPDVQNPDVLWTVKLDSTGGDLDEAMRIGRLLRRAFATTEASYRYARRPDGVYDFERTGQLVCLNGHGLMSGCTEDIVEAQCTGACLLVWLGGAVRHANEGQLGLHGLPGGESEAVRAYLRELGVPADWVGRIVADRPQGDGWLTWPERHALGGSAGELTTLIADCPEALTRDESYHSVVGPDEAERDRLMARAEARRSCRRRHLAAARTSVVDWLASRNGRSAPGAMASAQR